MLQDVYCHVWVPVNEKCAAALLQSVARMLDQPCKDYVGSDRSVLANRPLFAIFLPGDEPENPSSLGHLTHQEVLVSKGGRGASSLHEKSEDSAPCCTFAPLFDGLPQH